MKSTHLHGYHGLTQRADIAGWVIQARFNGRMRQIRTHTANVETAARRHDIALSKLEVFAEVRATPNFPEDFDAISVARDANAAEDYKLFWDDLHGLFNTLNAEADEQGIDPDEQAQVRKDLIAQRRVDQELNAQTARAALGSNVLKLVQKLPACRFSPADYARIRAKLLDIAAALKEVK